MANRLKFRIKYLRNQDEDISLYSIFNDDGTLNNTINRYFIFLGHEKCLSNRTIENIVVVIKVFLQFLSDANIHYMDADDIVLKSYRDQLLTTSHLNSNRDLSTRKRSINVYLRHIYDFYRWLQNIFTTHYILGTDGHRIRSSLVSNGSSRNRSKSNYPLCYVRVGEKSKHTIKFVPNHDDYRDMFKHISSSRDPVAARNSLMLRILCQTGLRVSSLASLTVHNFHEPRYDRSREHILVCPNFQKGGYSKLVEFPTNLANSIFSYIEEERSLITSKFSSTSDHIFLSLTTGKALNSHSISNLFIQMANALEWNQMNKGPHSWRRFFACEEIQQDIDLSIELGLDTSIEGIGTRLAEKLSHNSIRSQEAYVRDLKRRQGGSSAHKMKIKFQQERDRADSLELQNAQLRKIISRTIKDT